MQITLILVLIFSLIIATFAVQNTAVVTVRFLFWGGPLSLVQLILGSVALGALLMFLLGSLKSVGFFWKRRELTTTNAKLQQTIGELEKKIMDLKEEQKEKEEKEVILENEEQPQP